MPELPSLLTPGSIVILPRDTRDPVAVLCRTAITSERQEVRAALETAIRRREEMASTRLEFDVAVPHAHVPQLSRFVVAIGLCATPVPWPDQNGDEQVRIVVLIGAPEGRQSEYLRLLSRLVGVLRDADVRDQLARCTSPDEAIRLFCADPEAGPEDSASKPAPRRGLGRLRRR